MAIPNRQIGWSQESNLLSYISKQLEKLNGTVAATAAGGLLNPTTDRIPYNSGLAFGDSYLVNDTTSSVLKTVYSASDIGLKLDFASNTFTFGDDVINNNFLRFTIGANSNAELSTSFASIGDVFSLVNGTTFNVEDNNQTIKSTYGGNDIGLKLDFANSIYEFGSDLAAGSNGIRVTNPSGGAGAKIELGDVGGVYANGTSMIIDDANQRWEVSNNLTEATAGGSASKFLKVYINGVTYKLALLNNA